MFYWENTKGTDIPKTESGTPMCTRFYGTGVCFGNYNKAHTVLDQEEKATWKKFITHYREKHKLWLEYTNKKDNKGKEDKNEEQKGKESDQKDIAEEKKDDKKK